MTDFFTFSEQTLSYGCACESGEDGLLGDSACGGDGTAAESGEVIAIAVSDLLDDSELAQAPEVAREAGSGNVGKEASQVGAANAAQVVFRSLQGTQHGLRGHIEEVEALEFLTLDDLGFGQPRQVSISGREVVERRKIFQVAAIAAEQKVTQVNEAVDGFLEGSDRLM